MNLRTMIAQRIKTKGPGPFWILDCYLNLVERGICRDEALEALKDFAEEIIAAKERKVRQLQ